MIEIKIIDQEHKADINIPNQPFPLFGRMIPSYTNGAWSYTIEKSADETTMCFPDENYDYEQMIENSTFIGAYDNDVCIGLAIMQSGFFKYMYLYDLKVNLDYRKRGVAKRLIDKAGELALSSGYQGIYTQGQDDNLGACLFYIKSGFYIGGLDTNVYKGTKQEGKSDIIFYLDCGQLLETKDLVLRKAKYEDWESIYRNVWSRPETARYMQWKVTTDEEGARERMQRTIAWQENHDAWLVYEKKSGQAIGFAGMQAIGPHAYEETGIALGPEYVGKGYGKQVLQLLIEYCISLGGVEFQYSTWSGNLASKALAASAGFVYQYSEEKTDPRSGEPYELEIYKKAL